MRNRMLAFLSRISNLTETWGWRPQQTNPVRGVERAREQARDRVLTPSELTALTTALDDLEWEHSYGVPAIRVAALTGLRISEVLSLKWDNVDLETGRAVLDTKTGKRVMPVARPVLNLLGSLRRHEGNPYVFVGATPGGHAVYKTARAVFARACNAVGIEGARLHDLRRTAATRLAASGANAFLLRDFLGHATLTMSNRYVQQASDALTEAAERAAQVMTGNC